MKKELAEKIKPKLSESNRELVEMALLFQGLNEEQKYYISVLSEGMALSNQLANKKN
ncbi:Uncharacterised protein [[Clostridium] sordellii]|uniref:hypothetical protein n=1 Tax=Paraclostridium sordellii TaxID=1505 RepID=UPI000543F19B|nr:hypothetical protein [Paeniclostridium sordellii]CEK35726.1 hypothetical protein UMC2_26191 [[Clostridium] sordellii] [Paeniclostridium sordellii]CEQ10655.1 Uncharacterised protein [[Clostridium] sordellii] [Paeniclostridium sordellii]